MRTYSLFVIILLTLGLLIGCGGSEKKSAEPSKSESASTELLNANLASSEALAALDGLDANAAEAVTPNRPFLSMMALDSLLGVTIDTLDRESLYRKLYVPINLNSASEAECKLIPGVGDRMAHEFEEYRPYRSMEQFRREIGKYVDEAEVARLEQYLFLPIELNSASEEQILAIPGVGERMAHEFEEYRPYSSMAQFRKEIGKYVDANEVARLERYVMLSDQQ